MPTQVINHYLFAFGGPGAPVATPAYPGSGFFADGRGYVQNFDPITGLNEPMVIGSIQWIPVASLAANSQVWVVATMIVARGALTITPVSTPAGVAYSYYFGEESIVSVVAQVSNQTTPWVQGVGIELLAPSTLTLARGDTLFASMTQGTSIPHPTLPPDWTQIQGLGGSFIGSTAE